MTMARVPSPELSLVIEVDALPAEGETVTILADAAQRRALAARFGILAIDMLHADVVLKPGKKSDVVVGVALSADVVQSCVVSLEPVHQHIEDRFEVVFSPDVEEPTLPETVDFDDPAVQALLELPEPLIDGRIDIGELVAEGVALGLDPYPRQEGVTLDFDAPETQERDNPFAKLAGLKDRLENKE